MNIDIRIIKSHFKNVEDFEEYMNIKAEGEFLEYKPVKKCTDKMLRKYIEKRIDISRLNRFPLEERNRIIKEIYKQTGASIRQLAKALEIGKTIVEKAVK
ncbi:hypothetical protein [Caloranaerobacter sp. DY30410]|uniref:hypothetical protein n=1 Tax=Caloranaerobacter sp. DY30410 TaxID=3238305 RepID=UPI003D059D28